MGSFLREMLRRLGAAFKSRNGTEAREPSCSGTLAQEVEYVVDQTYRRLRFLSGYSQRLQGPTATTVRYIEALIERVPEAILCSRATFSEDLRVNAFFADPDHLQEVFSQSAEVHERLLADPTAEECWALLCMKKQEHRQLGLSLVGDRVKKDVMQTTVSFVDHQILSPATSEAGARHSLKCCIFNGLLTHIRKRTRDEKIRLLELENRRDYLTAHLHRNDSEQGSESRAALQRELDELGKTLAREISRSASLASRLDFVADILGNPEQYISGSLSPIHLSRMGVRLDGKRADDDHEIPLFAIRVASQGTRIAALVRFPRTELRPRRDLIHEADLFLTV